MIVVASRSRAPFAHARPQFRGDANGDEAGVGRPLPNGTRLAPLFVIPPKELAPCPVGETPTVIDGRSATAL